MRPWILAGIFACAICPSLGFGMAPSMPSSSGWQQAPVYSPSTPTDPFGTPDIQSAQGPIYQERNLTFDLSSVHDPELQSRILAALKLGFERADLGGRHIEREIEDLQGDGLPRTIRFYSDPTELGGLDIGTTAFASWSSPLGEDSIQSIPASRTELKIFIRPGLDYWYVVNNVWHELLHMTLTFTHGQTTTEGSIPGMEVNDGAWYMTIEGIMLDFPRQATDPVTLRNEVLYNPQNSPWS